MSLKTSATITIADRIIGASQPVFIIAEIGVNHNGDLRMAKRLIDAAVDAGADAVKFQWFDADKLVTADAAKAEYQERAVGVGSQQEMLRGLQLSSEDFSRLKEWTERCGLLFLCTPFDAEAAQALHGMDVAAFKVASGDLTDRPFLQLLQSFGRPIILSTGMATLQEVQDAQQCMVKTPHMFLHCTSEYPAPVSDLNLRAIATMARELGVPVGYSDHSESITTGALAVAAGAVMLERHITLDRNLPGPDHAASLEPDDFATYVQHIRKAEVALGSSEKAPVPGELKVAELARKSIHAGRDLSAGTVLKPEDLCIQRPADGASPLTWEHFIGATLLADVREGDAMHEGMLGDRGGIGKDS